MQTLCLEYGLRTASNWPKIQKMTMASQFSNMTSWSSLFNVVLFFLPSLFSGSRFHVNIVTGSGIMTIFFYNRLTRNPEIGNSPVWVLPNIWRIAWVIDTKFGTNISNRMSLNAARCQGYRFYRFWVIKGKPTGEGGLKLPPPFQIRVNELRILGKLL